ncbi:olfactory receptor 8A1-like [Ambystoma mexicanum]|uniref:olfactory receptor 8A1-like n=1 Tax=Ambystoma mexicanum TaxID=8296 RepID=UPI0037E85F8B
MEGGNQTSVTEFILVGITNDFGLQVPLFVLFLLFYIISLIGNMIMITLIAIESQLHTPMYFFLSNLSLSDFCYSSVIAPKMLVDFFASKKVISFMGCASQTYFFAALVTIEGYMLAAMAYDRYAAICHPLLYPLVINRTVCIQLVVTVYTWSFLQSAVYTGCIFHTSFCGPNVIDHFYCDLMPLMKLSCSDTFVEKTVIFSLVLFFGLACFLVTITSYGYIISAILKIGPNVRRSKAFSTCSSHLTVVFLFYGTALFIYLRLPSSDSVLQDKVVSIFYTLVNPMLNPLIYSLRNQELLFDRLDNLGVTYRNYADDTQVLITFAGCYDKDSKMLNKIYLKIQAWMAAHSLCLNDDKTVLLLIGSQARLNILDTRYKTFNIDGNLIKVANEVKTLGVY